MKLFNLRNTAIAAVLTLAHLLACHGSFAIEKEGHGGGVMVVNGHAILRDLVDSGTCNWTPINEVLAPMTRLPRVLASIAKTHWYLGDVISREASKIESVCLTEGKLRPVTAKELEKRLTIHYKLGASEAPASGDQVAVRVDNTLYLSMPVFRLLDDENQAYAMLHEISHGLIAENTDERSMKLISFIASVRENERVPLSRDVFARQLKGNGIEIIGSTETLDGKKKEILTALNKAAHDDVRRRAAKTVVQAGLHESLRADDSQIAVKLAKSLDDDLKNSIQNGTAEDIRRYVSLGADPNNYAEGNLVELPSKPFLVAAIMTGDLEKTKALLESPAIDVNKPFRYVKRITPYNSYSGAPVEDRIIHAHPVHVAITQSSPAAALLLLGQNGTKIESPTDAQEMLLEAVRRGYHEVVKALLRQDAVVAHINDRVHLHEYAWDLPVVAAVERRDAAILKTLLAIPTLNPNAERSITWLDPRRGGSDDFPGSFYSTQTENALFIAVKDKKPEFVAELLKHPEIDVNFPQSLGDIPVSNPLIRAIEDQNLDVIKLLSKAKGFSVNVGKSYVPSNLDQSVSRVGALSLATKTGNVALVRLLVSIPGTRVDGFDETSEGFFGRTAFGNAISSGAWAMVDAMMVPGALPANEVFRFTDFNRKKETAKNALGLIIEHGDLNLVKKLVRAVGIKAESTAFGKDCRQDEVADSLFGRRRLVTGCGKKITARDYSRKVDQDAIYGYLNSIAKKKETCIWFICF